MINIKNVTNLSVDTIPKNKNEPLLIGPGPKWHANYRWDGEEFDAEIEFPNDKALALQVELHRGGPLPPFQKDTIERFVKWRCEIAEDPTTIRMELPLSLPESEWNNFVAYLKKVLPKGKG